ncbi:hypothetical protein BGZ96_010296 [Linnemannia gamsii]|uniref:Uncharacterized protein n=1 Tax=Linnemannia gamsii TaxID=64522 RepID=A0ABQ7JV15_9FUNG|nr:hypothetical protein BGZ96_010296 [Linnemannia gamsii]
MAATATSSYTLQAEATETGEPGRTFEKRNLFSRLLNTIRDRSRNPRDRRPSHKHNVNGFNDEYDGNTGDLEEYSYWNAEEEDEEGIDEEDDLERHGGIYGDDDDDDDNDDNLDKGGFENLGLVSQVVVKASAPIVIEPFIRHPAHGSSLFDTDNSQDQVEDSNNHGESNNNNIDKEDEDLARIRASQPWYQQQLHPSSSSSKHHADNDNESNNEYDSNILRSQIWIVDEWDEDFDGVEETIDDLIDWIDDLDHVRARPASAPVASGSSGVRNLFF